MYWVRLFFYPSIVLFLFIYNFTRVHIHRACNWYFDFEFDLPQQKCLPGTLYGILWRSCPTPCSSRGFLSKEPNALGKSQLHVGRHACHHPAHQQLLQHVHAETGSGLGKSVSLAFGFVFMVWVNR